MTHPAEDAWVISLRSVNGCAWKSPLLMSGWVPGAKINGWAFTQHDGTVYWDHAGIITRTPQDGQSFESQRQWELAVGEGANLPQPVKDALKIAVADRNEDQQQTIRIYFLENVYPGSSEVVAPILAERTRLEGELTALNEAIPKSMVSEELPEPKPAFVLYRGEYDQPRDEVGRHLPSILPPLPEGAPNDRLGLAQWLVDPLHPLTSRVTVNRWWQRYFGTGLVKTSEDFGSQGDAPTHPLLLDWLATELIRTGWDVKAMQKLFVMSATYRQSSTVTPHQHSVDPANRFLSRGPRFRMEAEMIRDQALYVSGLLNEHLGGPSVKPYQPGGLWEAVGYTDSNTANFTQDNGDDLYRRSMYTFWKRTSPPPSMAAFDAPSRESCTIRRATTNTPLQALALMNDKQFIEASRHFGQRILTEGGTTDEERLAFGFRSVNARTPDADELAILKQVLNTHREDFASRPEEASAFIDSSTTQLQPNHMDRDRTQDPELAAWTMLSSLLLNLDEAITKGYCARLLLRSIRHVSKMKDLSHFGLKVELPFPEFAGREQSIVLGVEIQQPAGEYHIFSDSASVKQGLHASLKQCWQFTEDDPPEYVHPNVLEVLAAIATFSFLERVACEYPELWYPPKVVKNDNWNTLYWVFVRLFESRNGFVARWQGQYSYMRDAWNKEPWCSVTDLVR